MNCDFFLINENLIFAVYGGGGEHVYHYILYVTLKYYKNKKCYGCYMSVMDVKIIKQALRDFKNHTVFKINHYYTVLKQKPDLSSA